MDLFSVVCICTMKDVECILLLLLIHNTVRGLTWTCLCYFCLLCVGIAETASPWCSGGANYSQKNRSLFLFCVYMSVAIQRV